MKLKIENPEFSAECIISDLLVNGIFECYTLELPVGGVDRDGVHYDPLPAGKYRVIIDRSNRFSKLAGHDVFLPHILESPEPDRGTRIHVGNFARDTERCILVGRTKAKNMIGGSQVAFDQFFPKLQKAIASWEEVELEIIRQS